MNTRGKHYGWVNVDFVTEHIAKLTVDIPESMRADGRTYYLLRAHDGEASVIASGTGETLNGQTGLFSSYVLASKDASEGDSEKSSSSSSASKGATSMNSISQSSSSKSVVAKTGDAPVAYLVSLLALVGVAAVVVLLARAKREEG